MSTKFKLLALALIFMIPAVSTACEMTIFGNNAKAPKYWLEDGKPKGLLVDMMAYLGTQMNCDFDIQLYPWARAYDYATKAKGGIIGLSMTDERLKIFDYSDVMYVDELLLVVKNGSEFPYEKMDDLAGKKLGVTRDAKYGSSYSKAVKAGLFQIAEDTNPTARFKKLLAGRIDAAVVGPGMAGFETIINSDPSLEKQKDQFVVLPKPFKKDPNYMGISKDMNKTDFIKRFNDALKKGKDSGEIAKIVEKYSG